jgi:hypothetical protein
MGALGPAAALAGAPRFFAGVASNPRGRYPWSTVLNIYRSANGRMVASLPMPGREHAFAAVARLGGDRAYVAAAMTSFRACTTQLYRFTIGPRGRPSRLTPLSVPQVTGSVTEFVGSADGNVLAYTASGRCSPRRHALVGVIHVATRQVTTWTSPETRRRPDPAGGVSLTADGSVLGFLAGPDGRYGSQDAWVLPTNSPPGSLTRHARKVLRVRAGVFRAVLNNTGSQVYAETLSASRGGAVVLGLYSTATGKRIRVLGRLGPGGQRLAELSVSQDAAGQHLLVYGYGLHPDRVAEMNLTTGRLASVTVAEPPLGWPFSSDAW